MEPPRRRTAAEQERWERYLYETHPRAELATWVTTLDFFRFWRAIGGHSGDDADELVVAFAVPDRAARDRILRALGLAPTEDQPRHVTVAGERAFAWVTGDRLELTVPDPDRPFEVTPRSIAAARRVEAVVRPLAADVLDPPRDDEHCVCPRHHPELWAAG